MGFVVMAGALSTFNDENKMVMQFISIVYLKY